jgi:enoyl-CoA hydratase/carnithine racemase
VAEDGTGPDDGPVRLTVVDGVATVTIERPPANALGDVVVDGLHAALDGVAAAGGRVVVLRSGVPRFFAAGADLDLMAAAEPAAFVAYVERLRTAIDRIAALPVPVIVVLDGHALGGGLELALACTLRVATPRAKLGVPEIRLGLIPGAGGTQRLPRLIGAGAAADLVLTGRSMGGEEAFRRGLVDVLCEADALDADVAALAGRIAGASGPAVRAALRCLRAAADPDEAAGMAVELDAVGTLFAGADGREGIAAFHAGRAPRFEHR